MSFEENVTALGASTSGVILTLWAQYEAGLITLDEFREAAALVVESGRAQGAVIGALTVAAFLEVMTGAGVDVQAPRLPTVLPLILASLVTVTDGSEAPERTPMRLERLTSAQVQSAAQDGMQDAIEDSPEAEGWTRQLDSEACELCRSLKAGERGLMPKGSRMARHPKCACAPLPVIRIGSTDYELSTQTLVVNQGSVYRRGVGWMTRDQAKVWDVTGVVPDLDTLPPRQFVPAGSLTAEELASFPAPSRKQ